MRNRLVIMFAVAVGLLISVPLFAHHGGTNLYTDRPVTMKGTVKSWLWSNPHCLLTLDVKGTGRPRRPVDCGNSSSQLDLSLWLSQG